MKKLILAAIAAAFAFSVQAQDKDKSSAAGGASNTGNKGADAMFNALDKDKDGNLTKEETKGTPHEKDFTKLDKNGDGKLTPEEHAAAPEHAKDKAAAGATSGAKK